MKNLKDLELVMSYSSGYKTIQKNSLFSYVLADQVR